MMMMVVVMVLRIVSYIDYDYKDDYRDGSVRKCELLIIMLVTNIALTGTIKVLNIEYRTHSTNICHLPRHH